MWWCPQNRGSWRCFWDPYRKQTSTKRGYPMDDGEKAVEIEGWLEWKEWPDREKRKWGEEWLKQQGIEITEENKKLVWPYWKKKKKERAWEEVLRRDYKKWLRCKWAGRPAYEGDPLRAPVWPQGTDPDKRTRVAPRVFPRPPPSGEATLSDGGGAGRTRRSRSS